MKEYEGKKPVFVLLDDGYNRLKTQKPIGNGHLVDIDINSNVDSSEWNCIIAKCYFLLKNTGGEFSLIDVEATSNSENNLKSKISATCRLNPSIRAGFTAHSIELSLRNSLYELSPKEFIKLAKEVFSVLTLNFQYQYSNTSSSDLYQLNINNEIFTLERLI